MAEGAQATAGPAQRQLTGAPNIFFNDPFSSAATTGALNFAVGNDQNLRDTYIQQWNLNIQHKLPVISYLTSDTSVPRARASS